MNIHTVKFMSLLAIIITCAGCVKSPGLRPKNLNPLTKESAHDTQTKEQVTVYAKKLSSTEQTAMFGKEAKQLEKYKIIPVQITIENNGRTSLVFTHNNITLASLPIDEVNAKLFASRRWIPLWIALGGIAGILVLSPLVGACCAALFTPAAACPCHLFGNFIGFSLITAMLFGITTTSIATVNAVSNHMSRKEMQRYLKTYCNAEGITINPGIATSMLFFIEEAQLPEKINLLLTDKGFEKSGLSFELAI